jgi:hypothetical protein
MKCGGPGQKADDQPIAYIREDAVTQFDTHELCSKLIAQALFESLKCVTEQIRLEPQQSQERFAISLAIVVTMQTTRWPERQRERNCPCAGFGGIESPE